MPLRFRLRVHKFLLRWQHLLLPALLGVLYLALWNGPSSLSGKAFFIVHLGLFMLWQPFVHSDYRFSATTLLLGSLALIGSLMLLQGWMLLIWIMILTAIIGGKVSLFGDRSLRNVYQLAFASLIIALLFIAVPSALPLAKLPKEIDWLGHGGLLLSVLAMIPLIKTERIDRVEGIIDFINGLIVILILAALILGSLSAMMILGSSYAIALLQSMLMIGMMLLVLGWAWDPHAGFAGLGSLFSQYVMSVGLPIDQWLNTLTELALREENPEVFLAQACANMGQWLPWVLGVEWIANGRTGIYGLNEGVCSEFKYEEMILRIYTRYQLTATLMFHFNLPTKLLAKFYGDKNRDAALKKMSYMKAIHETGARLTHDVKNSLQTINALCIAANQQPAEFSADYQALLRRQLPAIAGRLSETLAKLNAPHATTQRQLSSAVWWWADFSRHVASSPWVSLESSQVTGELFADLFSGVTENLMSNASVKRLHEPALQLQVKLTSGNAGAELEFADNGSPIPEEIVRNLFSVPVNSKNGLGVGLYQAAQHAKSAGYQLCLTENRMGRVCFRLAPTTSKKSIHIPT